MAGFGRTQLWMVSDRAQRGRDRRSRPLPLGLGAILFGWAALAAAGPEWPDELSGGARLLDGTIVLVDDETRGSIFLWGGDPTHPPVRRPLGVMLDDLEGAAADSAGSIYLLTSHSLTRRGRARPDRQRLVRLGPGMPATPAPPAGGTAGENAGESAGVSEDAGVVDVVDDLTPALVRLLDTDPSHLNLEGLAWYPPGDELLLGVRAPLRDGFALVVGLGPVSRLFQTRDSEPSLRVDGRHPTVRALDLGGRGIRSLDYDPWRGAIWVLAGPAGEGGSSYALFLWHPGGGRIEAMAAPELRSLGKPEAVMALGPPAPATGETLLLIAGEGARPLRLAAGPQAGR